MENNEIINNEEIMETAKEVIETTSKGGAKKVVSVGAGIVIGVVATKYVLMPLGNKIKAHLKKRKLKNYSTVDTSDDLDEVSFVEVDDEE